MKDLVLNNPNATLIGTLRVDMLNNTPANITIMEVYDTTNKPVDYLPALSNFNKRLPYSWAAFLAFCVTNSIKVTAKDSNGTTSSAILSPIRYTIVTATNGTKSIVIATDVTAAFKAGDILRIYNADGTIYANALTHVSDSFGGGNTTIVVTEAFTDIGASSGKYLVNTTS